MFVYRASVAIQRGINRRSKHLWTNYGIFGYWIVIRAYKTQHHTINIPSVIFQAFYFLNEAYFQHYKCSECLVVAFGTCNKVFLLKI